MLLDWGPHGENSVSHRALLVLPAPSMSKSGSLRPVCTGELDICVHKVIYVMKTFVTLMGKIDEDAEETLTSSEAKWEKLLSAWWPCHYPNRCSSGCSDSSPELARGRGGHCLRKTQRTDSQPASLASLSFALLAGHTLGFQKSSMNGEIRHSLQEEKA